MSIPEKQENPLANIIINVLAPTLILSYLSKDQGKPWHLGPAIAMVVALSLPFAYGVWHFVKHRKLNIFSCVGLGAILLTGLITIYLWNNESAKQHVALIFGIKEAIQPLILGSLFLLTHRTATPLFRTFIYNENIFNIQRIEDEVSNLKRHPDYESLIWRSTLLFFGSFCISAILNLGLSFFFLSDLHPTASDWHTIYNQQVGKITFWGFAVIGAPLMIIGGYILFHMINGIKKITGMETDHIMIPR